MTTTTTPGAVPAGTTTPTVTDVRSAEVARLEEVAAAGRAAHTEATAQARAAAESLERVTTQLATLQQEASVLQQQLAAAKTGPERHTVELALDANRREQLRAGVEKLDATASRSRTDAAVAQLDTANGIADSDLAQAKQQLATAMADAGADAALRVGLDTDYATAITRAGTLVGPPPARAAQAVALLGALLGDGALVERVAAAVDTARRAGDGLRAAVVDAEAAVRDADAAASPFDGAVVRAQHALDTARQAVVDAVTGAPARVEAAATVLENLPAASPGQPTIDAAARAVLDGRDGAYDVWLVTLPDGLIDSAVAVVEAVHELDRIRRGDPQALRQSMAAASAALASAVSAHLTARRGRGEAVSAAVTARAALAAEPDPATRYRAAFLRGV